MLLTILALLIIATCVASLRQEGLWSNLVRLLNVTLAAILATNYFEPLAGWLQEQFPAYRYVWDFVSLWTLMIVLAPAFHYFTDRLSRYHVRFPALVDRYGGWAASAATGWLMVCFTFMTLHTAPLPERAFFGQFQPDAPMVLGLAPDRMWLGFVARLSRGPLHRAAERGEPDGQYAFETPDEFCRRYAIRRVELDAHVSKHQSLRVE
jgi:hypothetical protein